MTTKEHIIIWIIAVIIIFLYAASRNADHSGWAQPVGPESFNSRL